jgi:hypothetical protein
MQWLLANLFLLAIVLIGAGLLWLVGFLMWHFNLPPDDNPLLLMIGIVLALIAAYYIGKGLHRLVEKAL